MILTKMKAIALTMLVVSTVTASVVIGATQFTPQGIETGLPDQAASTSTEPEDSKATQPGLQKKSKKARGSASSTSASSSAVQKAESTPAKAHGGGGGAQAGGMMGMMSMMGSGPGGDGGEATVEFRNRIEIAQLAAALASWDKNPKNEAILKKLEEPISMSFKETPLQDVLKYIKSATTKSDQSRIPIYVDPIGLNQAERSLNSTVMIDLEGVPLKTSLRLILKQLGLAYCVRDGVLIISSVQGIREELAEAARESYGSGNEEIDMRRLMGTMGFGGRGMVGEMGGGMGGMGGGFGGMGGGMR